MQTQNEEKRASHGLATYMQLTFGTGYILNALGLVALVRCLVVNATYGSEKFDESPAAASGWAPPPTFREDLPRTRFWARRLGDFGRAGFIGAFLIGLIGMSQYGSAVDNADTAQTVSITRYDIVPMPSFSDSLTGSYGRYLSTAFTLVLTVELAAANLFALRVKGIERGAVWILFVVVFLTVSDSLH